MEKNKLWYGILIGVLVSTIIGLTGFIIYDKVLSNHDDNGANISEIWKEPDNNGASNNQQIQEVREISIESSLVKNLYQITGVEVRTTNFGLYNSAKLLIKDLDSQYLEALLYLQLPRDKAETVIKDSNEYLKWDGSTIKLLWAKMFGQTTSFKLSNQNFNGAVYEDDGTLILPTFSGRFEGPNVYVSELKKATQSNTEIVLYEAVKFIDFDTEKFYSNVEKTIETTETAENSANYKKIFKKDNDGNYYFYSVEKIN